MPFINREKELSWLNQKWAERAPQFLVLYGKRRVGKTELIKQFITGKPGVYYLADRRQEGEQLQELGRLLGGHFNDPLLQSHGFRDWIEMFEYLRRQVTEPLILAIDEYPYLVEANAAVSSLWQKGWDQYLKERPLFLILSGSSVAVMESEALLHKSPLYGRRTGQLLLRPLPFAEARQFFPRLDFIKALELYTVAGGLPAYLLQLDPNLSVAENARQKIFVTTEFLHNEVEFVLKEELRAPKNYLAILRSIALGKRKLSEITNDTGLSKNILSKYLSTLERLQVVEKEMPVTERQPHKSRRGLYRLSDNYFRFWFQYVWPQRSALELGRLDEPMRKLAESFNSMVAQVYEAVCQELLFRFSNRLFPLERAGRWWNNQAEIDAVGLNAARREIIFGEAKWSDKPVGTNILRELQAKARLVEWPERGSRTEHYILFSKSGFTPELLKLARSEGVALVEQDRWVE